MEENWEREREREREEREHNFDIRDILGAMKTRPKVTKENVLEFLEQDSINDYPDIEALTRKYGRNSACAERMRLQLDAAKYLNSQKPTPNPNSP